MKSPTNQSIFEYQVRPLYQGVVVLILIAIVFGIVKLLDALGLYSAEDRLYWIVVFSLILFYAIINCFMCFANEDQNRYWTESLLTYIGLSFLGFILAYLLTGQSILESSSFRVMFIVFTFVYIVLLTIMKSMKKIANYAEKEQSRFRDKQ